MVKLQKDYSEGKVVILQDDQAQAEVRLDDLSPEIVKRLAVYGLYVKLSRATAGKPKEEWLDRVLEVAELLKEGKWSSPSRRREPDGDKDSSEI